MKYECDKCAACCRQLIIEIDWIDVLREPSLKLVTEPFKVPPGFSIQNEDGEDIADPDPYMAGAMLACGSTHPCPKLDNENLCTIYPTRPNCCVAMSPGSEQCQEARAMAGLQKLEGV